VVKNEFNVLYSVRGEEQHSDDPGFEIHIDRLYNVDMIYRGMLEYYDGYVYFSKPDLSEDGGAIHTMHRVNVRTKRIEPMYEFDYGRGYDDVNRRYQDHNIILRTKDHIYWEDIQIVGNDFHMKIYRTDYWRNNATDIFVYDRGSVIGSDGMENIYMTISEYDEETGFFSRDLLYRINVSGGEPEIINYGLLPRGVFLRNIVIIGDHIYFLRPASERRIVYTLEHSTGLPGRPSFTLEDAPGEIRAIFDSEVYRMRLDGSELEMIFSDYSYDFWDIEAFGQYVVVTYWEEKSEELRAFGHEYGPADMKLVYDTVAGKWMEYE
jgi:hypothetical protein